MLEVAVKEHTEQGMKTTAPLPKQTLPNTMESFGHRDLTGPLVVCGVFRHHFHFQCVLWKMEILILHLTTLL